MKTFVFAAILCVVPAVSFAQTPAGPDLNASMTANDPLVIRRQMVLGTWTVRSNHLENKSIKICFGKDNKFKFVCPGARSEGTYEVKWNKIVLTYLKVDGEPVEFEMKKSLPLSDSADSFEVDTYHYEKAVEEEKNK